MHSHKQHLHASLDSPTGSSKTRSQFATVCRDTQWFALPVDSDGPDLVQQNTATKQAEAQHLNLTPGYLINNYACVEVHQDVWHGLGVFELANLIPSTGCI